MKSFPQYEEIPNHLRKYIVTQDPSKYTFIDHAVWRFILRQLTSHLSKVAHNCYIEGLKKTGISIEEIPLIENINKKLNEFGWSAVPVSGFIPPAAFMELQARGFLPIASDMRSIDHLEYTPAPDIVHEAAGHAPILIDPKFSEYLHNYAQISAKAVISSEDLELYNAIRKLSDLKESPKSTTEEIQNAEKYLEKVSKNMSHISEAVILSRMNWWTAEYGMIGDLENPKIYGAGLLSSLGESHSCFEKTVKKIPFSIECINFTYDITERQPQLFVTPDFAALNKGLEDLANMMAFRTGGIKGLVKIFLAKTFNTVEFKSGIQIGGKLKDILLNNGEFYSKTKKELNPIYLQFEEACELAFHSKLISGQNKIRHAHGFGCPIGFLENSKKCLSEMNDTELKAIGIEKNKIVYLKYASGIELTGEVVSILKENGKNLIFTFKNCEVKLNNLILFNPSWGEYDLAIGSSIPSVFGGPPDRDYFFETEDFETFKVNKIELSPEKQKLNQLFQKVRKLRTTGEFSEPLFTQLITEINQINKNEWLLKIELLEIAYKKNFSNLIINLENDLLKINELQKLNGHLIQKGIQLARSKYN